ncbi:MAG: resorcinol 4-hydroxylase [Solirubrobacteraceae bacterium]|nr:resorcinol 4-hydroxylase [Solirubrobacteraceae bacterium]
MTCDDGGVTTTIAGRREPAAPRTAEEVLQAAEDLVPVLREHAAQIDEDRRIPDHLYAALEDAGLFHILKPRRYAGFELSEDVHAMVTLTLARGCASTAWVFGILSGQNLAILCFPEEAQDDIWGADTYATLAGNTNLNPAAEAVRVDGGYRLTGSWGYCSGSDFAQWLIFNAPVGPGREGHMLLVPREEAETVDDWFPTGLRGTGSRTMRVTDAFVPDHRVIRTADTSFKFAERRALHPTFDAMWSPWPSHGRFTFAVCGLGAALGAAEHFAATSATATRVADALGGAVRLADQDYVASEYAEAAGELEMARLLVEQRSREAADSARRHVLPDEPVLAQQHRDNALVTRVALREVGRLHALVGAKAGFPQHPVSRAKRDAEMVAAHVTLSWRQAAVRYLASVTGAA